MLNYAMKTYEEEDIQIVFLPLALYGGGWSASHPSCFTLGERAPETQYISGWVGQETVWTLWRRENS